MRWISAGYVAGHSTHRNSESSPAVLGLCCTLPTFPEFSLTKGPDLRLALTGRCSCEEARFSRGGVLRRGLFFASVALTVLCVMLGEILELSLG